ncbi:MAG: amidohydrolase, partial [Bacteroidetes bacterium]|nr:amidohydrolase [Bacteroidota bacterium]
MKKFLLISLLALFVYRPGRAQETFPVNGTQDIRPGLYAFTNANIVVSAGQTIANGTLLVKDRLIEAVGQHITIPKGYVTIDLKGKYIYPALIDAYTTYGLPEAPRQSFNRGTIVPVSTKQGDNGWNEAIKPE